MKPWLNRQIKCRQILNRPNQQKSKVSKTLKTDPILYKNPLDRFSTFSCSQSFCVTFDRRIWWKGGSWGPAENVDFDNGTHSGGASSFLWILRRISPFPTKVHEQRRVEKTFPSMKVGPFFKRPKSIHMDLSPTLSLTLSLRFTEAWVRKDVSTANYFTVRISSLSSTRGVAQWN